MNQSKALAILKSGRNVFLTGSAGSGKTFVLNQYINYLKKHKIPVAITASTGIAATHLNGQTIHSWSGIGIKENLTTRDLSFLAGKKYLSDHVSDVKVLIIDEISMLHKNQLELVNQVLQFFKSNQLPFGGIQIVFCGDFFQLPPIGKTEQSNREKFSFMSNAWVNSNLNICYLSEQHRQEDQKLTKILNEIREGSVTQNSIDTLNWAVGNTTTEKKIQLFTHNYNVDKINNQNLQKLKNTSKLFTAKTKGNPKLLESLKKSILTSEKLDLKMGAKVMFIKNNYEKGYMNGTLGEVDSFSEKGFPIIKTVNQRKIIAEQETWSIQDESGKALVSFVQIPLRLAWAITIHKSQGMTLDEAEIDLSETFEKGQGYVALSRVKSFDGINLLGFNSLALEVDDLALRADKRFRQLSQKIDLELEESELEQEFAKFILDSDGVLFSDETSKKEKLIKEKTKSTYQKTQELINEGLDLAQIIEKRGLSETTIIDHLKIIQKDYPDQDFSRFRPKNEIIVAVEKMVDLIKQNQENLDKPIGLKAIFESLGEELSYKEIKLALLFIDKE
jgi:hypothetical protein